MSLDLERGVCRWNRQDKPDPHKGGNDAFWRLHRLDANDKHRVLYVVGAAHNSVIVEIKLPSGTVISIEPGLYYPERGFGVRVEDLCYVDASGSLISLTDFRKDLVLPLKTR